MDDGQLEERLRLLEASLEVQEEVMVALQEERIDAARLSQSVERLAMGSDALVAALLQVDRNQQQIAKLDKDIKAVECQVTPVKDIKDQIRKTRRRLIAIVASGVLLTVALYLIGTRYADARAREEYLNCQQRLATAAAIQSYLTVVAAESTNPDLKKSAQEIIDLYPANPLPCEQP